MENTKNIIPQKNIKRLKIQGFTGYTDKELSNLRPGIRFAYWLCASFVLAGLFFNSIPVLSFAFLAAFGAVIHSRHPFDYIYNYATRHILNKPKTPKRAIQGKIACGIASFMIFTIILLFHNGFMSAGYIVGGALLSSAVLVASTDICIPSIFYQLLKKNTSKQILDKTENI